MKADGQNQTERTLKLNCAKAKAMVLGRNKLIVIIYFFGFLWTMG
jgi:hypothetical protein